MDTSGKPGFERVLADVDLSPIDADQRLACCQSVRESVGLNRPNSTRQGPYGDAKETPATLWNQLILAELEQGPAWIVAIRSGPRVRTEAHPHVA